MQRHHRLDPALAQGDHHLAVSGQRGVVEAADPGLDARPVDRHAQRGQVQLAREVEVPFRVLPPVACDPAAVAGLDMAEGLPARPGARRPAGRALALVGRGRDAPAKAAGKPQLEIRVRRHRDDEPIAARLSARRAGAACRRTFSRRCRAGPGLGPAACTCRGGGVRPSFRLQAHVPGLDGLRTAFIQRGLAHFAVRPSRPALAFHQRQPRRTAIRRRDTPAGSLTVPASLRAGLRDRSRTTGPSLSPPGARPADVPLNGAGPVSR